MQHIEFFKVVPEFGFEITPKMTQPSAQYPVLKGLRERFFISAAVLLFCPNFRPPCQVCKPFEIRLLLLLLLCGGGGGDLTSPDLLACSFKQINNIRHPPPLTFVLYDCIPVQYIKLYDTRHLRTFLSPYFKLYLHEVGENFFQ